MPSDGPELATGFATELSEPQRMSETQTRSVMRFPAWAKCSAQTSKTGGCRFESYRPCPVEYARASWKKPRSHGLFAFSGRSRPFTWRPRGLDLYRHFVSSLWRELDGKRLIAN